MMALWWRPDRAVIDDARLLADVESMSFAGQAPLHQELLDMLGSVSQRILSDPELRRVPQYVVLAYWLRPAALSRLAEQLRLADPPGQVRAPRGVALHLPPANVDTIFVYSWALSVLAGNTNVVRLAERLSPMQERLVDVVVAAAAGYHQGGRHMFCSYAYGGETERALARYVDLRMVWGGDAKVEAVSAVSVRPDGLSIGFPDRQSLAVVATAKYAAADDSGRNELADRFFNDVFWFDQMGCGSPRLLVWLGDPGPLAADFYARVTRVVVERGYHAEPGVTIGKFALANRLLAEGLTTGYRRFPGGLDVCRCDDPSAVIGQSHGGGFLYEWVASIDEIPRCVTRKTQTIAYYGVTIDELRSLAHAVRNRGCYRMVPIGQALQFDPVWDGVDLYDHMTRRIVIK